MRFIYTKAFAIFCFCVIAIAILAFLQVKGLLFPLKNVLLQTPRPVVYVATGVARPVKSFFTTLFQLRKIAKENTELKTRVFELEQNSVELDQQRRENETLRGELGFVKNSKANFAPCSVVTVGAFGPRDSLVLNCGQEQGVAQGQAVTSQGFLVGKIIYSDKNSSTALLVTSSKFLTDAKISKTGANGLVKGSFDSGLVLDQLSQNDEIEKDWLVVTAGINEKIPKNILIGGIGEVISTPNDLFKKATLLSPIDFSSLEFVFVSK